MNLTAPFKVIIVEDQIAIRQQLEDFFQHQYNVILIGVCGTVNEAIKLMGTTQPDLFFIDTELRHGTGFDILEQIPLRSKAIFLAYPGEYPPRAIGFGAIDYLLKSFDGRELINALGKVVSAPLQIQQQIAITLQSLRTKQVPDYIVLGGNYYR